ncbi:c-type cytochrome [Motilibacter sp. E257]|uniref:Cytochrome bc1 complex cytochrome c subunit n=2 Tax=Motilibacter deserti TaxID=2714956 RepID=A0ABX0GPM4_9ACTN|nr:cytochrome c [Motilibacter deserti]NHC12415.1 c-type cytochrome [Motilibacter deserti]
MRPEDSSDLAPATAAAGAVEPDAVERAPAAAVPARTRKPLRRRPLGASLLLLVALGLVGAVYSLFAPANADVDAPGSAQAGRELFLANCSSCHGTQGQGSSAGPTLVGVGAASVEFQVGTGRMPLAQPGAQAPRDYVRFSDEEIADMAAYVATLGPGPSIPSDEDLDLSEADVTRGGDIFRTNCTMCHNYAGSGGALTEGKYAPSVNQTSPRHIYEAMLTGPQNMPVFADSQLTPEMKRDVIAYIKTSSEHPSPGITGLGALGPSAEGLFGWVVALGLLLACAVWLTQKAK